MNTQDPIMFSLQSRLIIAAGLIFLAAVAIIFGYLTRNHFTDKKSRMEASFKAVKVSAESSAMCVIIMLCGLAFGAVGAYTSMVKVDIKSDGSKILAASTCASSTVEYKEAGIFMSEPKEASPGNWNAEVAIVQEKGKSVTKYRVPLKSKDDKKPYISAVGTLKIKEPTATPLILGDKEEQVNAKKEGLNLDASYWISGDTAKELKRDLDNEAKAVDIPGEVARYKEYFKRANLPAEAIYDEK